MDSVRESPSGETLRRWLVVLLTLGLVGTGADLVVLEHFEDSWQLIPLFLIAVALVALAAVVLTSSAVALRVLQLMMVLCVIAGGLGLVLHYRSNAEMQRDMDPTLSGWALFRKVIHAKAPPAMAPAAMAQLGLLGLAFCYRHPALSDDLNRMLTQGERT
jgi:hypothetical protein